MINGITLYVCDTETTSLNPLVGDIIEISLYRLSDDVCRTWWMRAVNEEGIEDGALKVNGYKKEDITCKTPDGKKKFQEPKKVLSEIENWLMEDCNLTDDRFMIGHNVSFDYYYLKHTYDKHNLNACFPFGRRMIDTAQIELLFDCARGERSESYSLSAALKKYAIKNSKAHTAESDTIATKCLFLKQIDIIKSLMKNGN